MVSNLNSANIINDYIAEEGNKRLPGKIYIPTLVGENLDLQLGFSLLLKISQVLEQKNKHGYSPFTLIIESMTSRIMERTRFTFQNGYKAKGKATLFFNDIKNSNLSDEIKTDVSQTVEIINELYKNTVGEYESRDIHLNDDHNVTNHIIVEPANSKTPYKKTIIERSKIDMPAINLMYEHLAIIANKVRGKRYCHVTRINNLDKVIIEYERLFNIKIKSKTELKKMINNGTKHQIKLLSYPNDV